MVHQPAQWYVSGNGDRPLGPYTESWILDACRQGNISPNTLCRRAGETRWLPLAQVQPFASNIGRAASTGREKSGWFGKLLALLIAAAVGTALYYLGGEWLALQNAEAAMARGDYDEAQRIVRRLLARSFRLQEDRANYLLAVAEIKKYASASDGADARRLRTMGRLLRRLVEGNSQWAQRAKADLAAVVEEVPAAAPDQIERIITLAETLRQIGLFDKEPARMVLQRLEQCSQQSLQQAFDDGRLAHLLGRAPQLFEATAQAVSKRLGLTLDEAVSQLASQNPDLFKPAQEFLVERAEEALQRADMDAAGQLLQLARRFGLEAQEAVELAVDTAREKLQAGDPHTAAEVLENVCRLWPEGARTAAALCLDVAVQLLCGAEERAEAGRAERLLQLAKQLGFDAHAASQAIVSKAREEVAGNNMRWAITLLDILRRLWPDAARDAVPVYLEVALTTLNTDRQLAQTAFRAAEQLDPQATQADKYLLLHIEFDPPGVEKAEFWRRWARSATLESAGTERLVALLLTEATRFSTTPPADDQAACNAYAAVAQQTAMLLMRKSPESAARLGRDIFEFVRRADLDEQTARELAVALLETPIDEGLRKEIQAWLEKPSPAPGSAIASDFGQAVDVAAMREAARRRQYKIDEYADDRVNFTLPSGNRATVSADGSVRIVSRKSLDRLDQALLLRTDLGVVLAMYDETHAAFTAGEGFAVKWDRARIYGDPEGIYHVVRFHAEQRPGGLTWDFHVWAQLAEAKAQGGWPEANHHWPGVERTAGQWVSLAQISGLEELFRPGRYRVQPQDPAHVAVLQTMLEEPALCAFAVSGPDAEQTVIEHNLPMSLLDGGELSPPETFEPQSGAISSVDIKQLPLAAVAQRLAEKCRLQLLRKGSSYITVAFRHTTGDVAAVFINGTVAVASRRPMQTLADKDILETELALLAQAIADVKEGADGRALKIAMRRHMRVYADPPGIYHCLLVVPPPDRRDWVLHIPNCQVKEARWFHLYGSTYVWLDGNQVASEWDGEGRRLQLPADHLPFGSHDLAVQPRNYAGLLELVHSPCSDGFTITGEGAARNVITRTNEPVDALVRSKWYPLSPANGQEPPSPPDEPRGGASGPGEQPAIPPGYFKFTNRKTGEVLIGKVVKRESRRGQPRRSLVQTPDGKEVWINADEWEVSKPQ